MRMNRIKFVCLALICLFWGALMSANYTNAQNKNTGEYSIKMTGISTQMVKYISGKDTVSAYLTEPQGNGPFPGLIVIHEWWGLNNRVKKDAEDFAHNGYVALAIDLYHGKSTVSPDEARKLSGSIQQEQASLDLKSAFDYLKNMQNVDKNKIGSIGWCMGGGYSLKAAIEIPELSACVVNYGRLVTDTETLKKINCPLLGIFGENDQNINPTVVGTFKDALGKAGIKNKIITYPGVGHAFMNPDNPKLYNKQTTAEAKTEISTFLDTYLKQDNK